MQHEEPVTRLLAASGRRRSPIQQVQHAAFGKTDLKLTVLNLDVLRVHVGVGVQQQADDGGVASQHGPVQCRVLVVLVAQVHRNVEGQQQPGGVNAAKGAETVNTSG